MIRHNLRPAASLAGGSLFSGALRLLCAGVVAAGLPACAAAKCTLGTIDSFDDPDAWTFNPEDSPWATDVSGVVAFGDTRTEGESAARLIFDGARGHGKGQILRRFPYASGDFSCGTHVAMDVFSEQALLIRMDFHDADFGYHRGEFVALAAGENHDVTFPLAVYPERVMRSFNTLSFMLTGYEPDSVVAFDNLRLLDEAMDAGEPAGGRRAARLPGDGGVLSAGTEASSSSIEGPDYPAANVIDGDPATRWASASTDEQHIDLALPAPVEFNQLAIDWETAYAVEYRVLAALGDGETAEVASVTEGRGGVETVTFPPVTADRVRIEFARRGTQFGYSIYDLQLRLDRDAEPGVSNVGGAARHVEGVVGFEPRAHHASRHDGAPRASAEAMFQGSVPVYEAAEFAVDLDATHDNPYDPEDIDVTAEFTGPGGLSAEVPAFFMQPFDRKIVAGQEQLVASGDPQWRVRFTPTSEGAWRMRVRVSDRHGEAQSEEVEFHAAAPARDGFVRLSPENRFYFATDETPSFFPIGLNMCWFSDYRREGALHTLAYDRWLEALAANGGNFIRIWMFSISFSPEWTDTGLGQYDERQPQLWRLDHILRRCEELGIRVQVCLLNHGQLTRGANSEWSANPYNIENGGPLAEPEEFLTDPLAREMFRRRLRYLMARYAHSPAVFSWEWFNEIEHTPLDNEHLPAWLDEMTAVVERWDPNDHLITTSSKGSENIYGPPSIDYVQPHMYEVGNWPPAIRATVQALRQKHGKAVFAGEIGIEHRPPTMDLGGRHLHTANWASLMSGAAGGGMTWWWDSYVDPRDLWPVYRGIAAFVEDEDLPAAAGPGRTFTVAHPEEGLEAMVLDLEDRSLVWIRQTGATAAAETAAGAGRTDRSPVEGAVLSADELGFEPSRVEWWDTESGEIVSRAGAGDGALKIPAFVPDIAAKVFRQEQLAAGRRK